MRGEIHVAAIDCLEAFDRNKIWIMDSTDKIDLRTKIEHEREIITDIKI